MPTIKEKKTVMFIKEVTHMKCAVCGSRFFFLGFQYMFILLRKKVV
jgi:hypothetical protein